MTLFVTDAELCRRVPLDPAHLRLLTDKAGFPPVHQFYGGRFWPDVVRFIAHDIGSDAFEPRGGIEIGIDPHVAIVPPYPDEQETRHAAPAVSHRRRRRAARA